MINLQSLILAHRQHTGRKDKRIRKIRAIHPPRVAELSYKAELLRIVALLTKAKDEILLPILQETAPLYARKANGTTDAAYHDRIATGLETMARRFGGIQSTANRLADLAVRKAAGESDAAFKSSVKNAIGIDISPIISSGQIGDEIEAAIRANVALIKSIPSQYFDKIEQSVWTNTGQGMRYDGIEEDLLRIDGVTESRAKLIARDQTGKINGAITEARQTSLGIDKYTWRTSNDERVRDNHADKEGEVYSWDDPPEDTGHPGEDIQCRCTAEPYFDLDAMEEDLGLAETGDE